MVGECSSSVTDTDSTVPVTSSKKISPCNLLCVFLYDGLTGLAGGFTAVFATGIYR